jgi:DEAD/DEAH box helicase domain-containing protein
MSLQKLLDNWRASSAFTENIVAWHTRPARPADTSPLPPELHPAILTMLRGQGIDALYSHQSEAWTQIQAGRHPVIVTGTASGKSLCYNLPALNSLLHQSDSRALYLFPTKALARDQTAALQPI